MTIGQVTSFGLGKRALHHPMAGKKRAGLLVSRWVGELRVDSGVLNVSVSQPVFDKG